MRTPSIAALEKAFPGYDAHLLKALLTDTIAVDKYNEEHNLTQRFYHPRHARLIALNHALEMYGVEHIGQVGERGFYFLNTGDSYAATIIQFDDKDSLFISSWGDIVERGQYK